jgi:agmatinase
MKVVNFGDLEEEYTQYDKSQIVILPVSFDKTSTWLKGSERGPRAIIDASRNLELYDIDTGTEVYRNGIYTAGEIRPESSDVLNREVHSAVLNYIQDRKFTVLLGGEHSVSYGAIKAHLEQNRNLSVLQLDAHTDMRDIYEGNIYSHACTMARVRELTRNITSVGIRSMDSSELKNLDMRRMFFAKDLHDNSRWFRRVIRQLEQKIYLSIDLDVFDPSLMPSTGTPEPGGLLWYQTLDFLKEVAKRRSIVGFDVVELCPGSSRAPDFLAAKLVYTLLSFIFSNKPFHTCNVMDSV